MHYMQCDYVQACATLWRPLLAPLCITFIPGSAMQFHTACAECGAIDADTVYT